ncbi:MAG: cyclic nucleotide-binding domain-containing protein [Reyranellales bacterium]
MRDADLPMLRRSRLLAQVPAQDTAAMLDGCSVETMAKGSVLCEQGEKPELLHIVLSGQVGLFGEAAGSETLVEFFGPGDAFILAAVMLDAPYLLTARLIEESRILMWPAADFRERLQVNGALACGASQLLAVYWRTLVSEIKELKLASATERLAAFLLGLAPRKDGPVTFSLPGGRRLVAARLGIKPESLSRLFAALRERGVTGGGRQVTIADPDRLRDFG